MRASRCGVWAASRRNSSPASTAVSGTTAVQIGHGYRHPAEPRRGRPQPPRDLPERARIAWGNGGVPVRLRLAQRAHLVGQRVDPCRQLRPALFGPGGVVVMRDRIEAGVPVRHRLDAAFQLSRAAPVQVGDRDTQLGDLRGQLVAQHSQRLCLLAGHQDPLALCQQGGNQVRDGVRLAGAGRTLHDHAVVGLEPVHDPGLLRVRGQREQRVGADGPPGRGALLRQPGQPLGGLHRGHQLGQARAAPAPWGRAAPATSRRSSRSGWPAPAGAAPPPARNEPRRAPRPWSSAAHSAT